jgi:ATP-dependent exoDNAse (exonuclease V) beta subunit
MNDAAPHDAAERAAALDTRRSFIVQAPAGSGKTELLIQRYLALLATVERPESIVAMTFTRKAAGEIRERIVRALREPEAALDAEPSQIVTARLARAVLARDRASGWSLETHPARLQVQTIDALCMTLVRQAPLSAKLGALPRPVERAEALYVDAAREELLAAGPADDAWRRLLEHLDNDGERAVLLIANLLAKREQWLPHIVDRDPARLRREVESVLEDEIESVLRALVGQLARPALATLAKLSRRAAGNLAAANAEHPLALFADRRELPPASADGLAHWQAVARWLLTARGALRVTMNAGNGLPAQDRAAKAEMEALLRELAAARGFETALQVVGTLPPSRYDADAWSFVEALLVVLPRAAARLRLIFARHGVMDFNEATLCALAALGDDDRPSDLLLALDTRIDHLLVDEFQDTSFAQFKLIQRLTAGWQAGDGRTLFLVGDPMQSIYRFRDANVRLFLEARARGRIGDVSLEPLTLASNFRSQRALVAWMNDAFAKVLPSDDEPVRGIVSFTKAHAARREALEPDVTLDLELNDQREASRVVERVCAALATDAKTIAVLVRKRTDLAEILPALRGAGIAFAAVELDRLSERQAMLDLAALMHALLQPDDRAAWLAVLRAPWCGLELVDLFALVEACGARSLATSLMSDEAAQIRERLSADGRARFDRFAATVVPALRARGRSPLSLWVRGIWVALGGPACVAEPAVDLDAAEKVFALIAEHAAGSDIPEWADFAAELDLLHAPSDEDPATRVRVMTLHKAKGLEFDVVLMPGLTRPTGSSESQLLLWRERVDGLLLAPIRDRARDEDDPVYAYLRALDAAEDDAELRRLLYVGCTRAKRSLHLSAVLDVEQDHEGKRAWKTPRRGTLLAALWPALEPRAPDEAFAPTDARTRIAGVPLVRLPLSWKLPSPPESAPLPPQAADEDEREPIEFDWAHEAARRIGVVSHRLLARIAQDGLERWSPERIAAERPRIARELAQAGFTGTEASAAVDQIVAAIENTLSDPRGRWLFDERHRDASSEYALTHWRDKTFVHRVLDRTFIDAGGTRWIVDFKLSRHEGTALDAFLDRERERYAAQLEGYAAAMRALDERQIRLGLYFPLLRGWREWAPGEASAGQARWTEDGTQR